MKVKTEHLFPAELAAGVEIWDPREGQGRWAPVVAACSGDQQVLVWLDGESEAVPLPAAERVATHHVVADFMVDDDPDESTHFEQRLTDLYSGDLDSARAAVAQKPQSTPRAGKGRKVKLGKHLKSHYSGDITSVLKHHR